MPQGLMEIIWSAVGIIVTGLVGWGVTVLTVWLNGKIKDKRIANLLTTALNIVADAVKMVFQEFVETLKKNGKFDAEAQREAKERALKIIKSKLTPELTDFIKENFGDVEAWISEQIEVAIYNFKNK